MPALQPKTITTPAGEKIRLRVSHASVHCDGCGRLIRPHVHHLAACADCGALFCETCVTDGTFDAHVCEDDDEKED